MLYLFLYMTLPLLLYYYSFIDSKNIKSQALLYARHFDFLKGKQNLALLKFVKNAHIF